METEGSWKFPPPVHILSYTKPFHALNPTSWRSILILSSHLCLILLSGLFPSGFSTITLYAPLISSISATCPAHLFHLGLITRISLVRSTNHYAPHYVVVSTPLSPRPSEANIFSSAPYSQTHSAYVPPSMRATMLQTHIKQEAKLHFWLS